MELTQRQAALCAALGDYNRLLLLYALADEPHSVNELVARVGLSQPAVSRHLRIMRESGLVSAERHGRSVVYGLVDQRILAAMDLLRAVLTEQMEQQGHVARAATQRPPI